MVLDIKKKLGARISALRKIKGFTQQKFAEKIGIATSSLSYIETGVNFPHSKTLEKIVEVLEITADELFTFNDVVSNDDILNILHKKIDLLKDNNEKLKILLEFLKILA